MIDNNTDVGVQRMKDVLRETTERQEYVSSLEEIATFYDKAFKFGSLKDPEFVASKILVQAMWYLMNKIKLHSFTMHGVEEDAMAKEIQKAQELEQIMANAAQGEQAAIQNDILQAHQSAKVAEDAEEYLVTECFAGVLDDCNYLNGYNGMKGMKFNSALYGSAFRMIMSDENTKLKGVPFWFNNVDPRNIYTKEGATSLHYGNKDAEEIVIVFRLPSQAVYDQYFDEFQKLGVTDVTKLNGMLPRTGDIKDLDQVNASMYKNNETEIAYYFKISDTKTAKDEWTKEDCGLMYRVAVGPAAIVVVHENGDDYEFMFDNSKGKRSPYIPVTGRFLYPSAKGFFCYGLGHVVMDIAKEAKRLMNMSAASLHHDALKVSFVGIPDGVAKEYQALYKSALAERSKGNPAFVPIPNSSGALNLQQLSSGGDLSGVIAMKRELELELKRLGIYLDEIQGYAATATQAELDAAKAGAFIEFISQNNYGEAKFELEVSLSLFKNNVENGNKTPLNLRASYGDTKIKGLNYGALKEILEAKHWFFVVDPSSGEVPFAALRRMQLRENLQFLQAGSPEYNETAQELVQLSGRSAKKLSAPIAPPPTGQNPLPKVQ